MHHGGGWIKAIISRDSTPADGQQIKKKMALGKNPKKYLNSSKIREKSTKNTIKTFEILCNKKNGIETCIFNALFLFRFNIQYDTTD